MAAVGQALERATIFRSIELAALDLSLEDAFVQQVLVHLVTSGRLNLPIVR